MYLFARSLFASLLGLAVTGCGPSTSTVDKPDNPPGGHPHSSAHSDALYWQRENIEHEGLTISLGHHDTSVYAEHDTEPAVMIMRDGKPVSDAKVFVTLLSADGSKPLGEEQSTIYEPTTDAEPAHYAQATLKVPANVDSITVRYRIEFAGDMPEFTKDVPIAVRKH